MADDFTVTTTTASQYRYRQIGPSDNTEHFCNAAATPPPAFAFIFHAVEFPRLRARDAFFHCRRAAADAPLRVALRQYRISVFTSPPPHNIDSSRLQPVIILALSRYRRLAFRQ